MADAAILKRKIGQKEDAPVPDWAFEILGVIEAIAIVTMLVTLSRYDRDHPLG